MADEQPHALTIRGMFSDMAVSAIFLIGTGLVDYLKHRLPAEESLSRAFLLIGELALLCFALGYLLYAMTYLWNQFSYLVEHIAESPTWPRLVKAFKYCAGLAVHALTILLVLAVGLSILAACWTAFIAIMHAQGKLLAPLLESLDRILGVQRIGAAPEPGLPEPIATRTIFFTVIGLLLVTWVTRGFSYLVQRKALRGALVPSSQAAP
jgi:hypothetical protein